MIQQGFDEFVDYAMALKLKELGFINPCIARYRKGLNKLEFNMNVGGVRNSNIISFAKTTHTIDAPTLSQVLLWFRRTHNFEAGATFSNEGQKWMWYFNDMRMTESVCTDVSSPVFNDWEEAVNAVIWFVIDKKIGGKKNETVL